MKKIPWSEIFKRLRKALEDAVVPSVSQVAGGPSGPYEVLVSTVISLRTKDEVTLEASRRLFDRASSPRKLLELDESLIGKLIYPAGFYKTKARNLKKIAAILVEKYNGQVPEEREALLALPGVGRKTANLVLNLGYGKQAICVDTHVHRISNRTGWIETRTPDETEMALMKILPGSYWIEINELLVKFGQNICRPQSPFCSRCPLEAGYCQKRGVIRQR